MAESGETALIARQRLAERQLSHRLGARLAQVVKAFSHSSAVKGVMRQRFDGALASFAGESFKGRHGPGVERGPALVQQRAIDDLVYQGMSKFVLHLGEQTALERNSPACKLASPRRSSSSAKPLAARSNRSDTTTPMTAALCSSCFSATGKRSTRSAKTVCTVLGIRTLSMSTAER